MLQNILDLQLINADTDVWIKTLFPDIQNTNQWSQMPCVFYGDLDIRYSLTRIILLK